MPRYRRPVSPAAPRSERHIYCTSHALKRLQMHRPSAGFRDAQQLWAVSTPIDGELVQALTGRRPEACSESRYRITPCCKGIFVIVPVSSDEHLPWAMVTYLRLMTEQREMALSWGLKNDELYESGAYRRCA